MEYIDPQKARQERERQERERQARLKAERDRKARIEAEKAHQAKLKAERDRKARLKAEQEAAKKAQKAEHPDKKNTEPKPEAKKPKTQKPENKKPDPTTLTYSSISPIQNTISPIAQLPQTELKPQAPLNRNPRNWKNEKADEPKPYQKADLSGLKAKIAEGRAQKEQKQQEPLQRILNDPNSTETQRQTAKVLSARLKAQTIERYLTSDRVTLLALLPNGQPNDQTKSLFNQWLDTSKERLGPGEEKGLEQYYTDNSRTLKTLEWIINSAQKPDQPQSQRFKPYLTPTNDPKDKIELIALKNGSLKDLVNKTDSNNKNVWVNGDQIVRAVTKTDAQGKPVTEYFVPKNGAEVHSLSSSSNSDPQQQKPHTEWVKIAPPSNDQKIVSVDATELTQGKQPTRVASALNISGAEQHTHKRYNAISQRYEDYTNPTFTEYQQLRGDTPRVLTGSNLRNEIGMAMFNSSLGFTPNNAPQAGTPEAELLKQGKWQGDLFNGTTLPEQYKNLSPEQQKQKQEQFKRQQETISKVEEKIKEVGGENAKVTTLPITVDVTDAKTILQLPLFRVTGKDGKDRFVDENGRLYQDMADWKANNKLPPGRVSYFADGRINDRNNKPNIITENSHAVIDTTGERVKSVADTVLPWLGIAAGAVLIASGVGAPIGAGLITAATVTMAGVGAYGLSQGVGTLSDRGAHGQSNTDLTDAEVRETWLGLTADALSMFAVGSALRLGKNGLKVVEEVGTVSKALSVGAQYADTAAIGNSTVDLAKNWDRLTPQQQLASIGQLGFWGMSTGVSAKQAGGIKNLYGAQSIRESFGGKEIPVAQSPGLNPGEVNVSYGKGTPNVNHGGEVDSGNIQIHVDKAKEIRKENSPLQKVKDKVLGNKPEFEYGTKGWELNHEASKHQAMAESVFAEAKVQREKGNAKAADNLEQEAHELLRSSYEYRASANDPRVRNTPGDGEIAAGKRQYTNHSEIESLIGKKFNATTTKLPAGYQVIEIEHGRKICAVINSRGSLDLSKGILLVKPDGKISVDPQNRTSYNYTTIYRNDPRARADVLAAGFGLDGYTIHHVIADKVASTHPLTVMDMRLNKFTVDTFENYAPLPMKNKFFELQGAEVGHWSSHEKFDGIARAKLTAIQEKLQIKYSSPISEWPNHPKRDQIAAELKREVSALQSSTLSDIENGNVPMTDEGLTNGIGRIN